MSLSWSCRELENVQPLTDWVLPFLRHTNHFLGKSWENIPFDLAIEWGKERAAEFTTAPNQWGLQTSFLTKAILQKLYIYMTWHQQNRNKSKNRHNQHQNHHHNNTSSNNINQTTTPPTPQNIKKPSTSNVDIGSPHLFQDPPRPHRWQLSTSAQPGPAFRQGPRPMCVLPVPPPVVLETLNVLKGVWMQNIGCVGDWQCHRDAFKHSILFKMRCL